MESEADMPEYTEEQINHLAHCYIRARMSGVDVNKCDPLRLGTLQHELTSFLREIEPRVDKKHQAQLTALHWWNAARKGERSFLE